MTQPVPRSQELKAEDATYPCLCCGGAEYHNEVDCPCDQYEIDPLLEGTDLCRNCRIQHEQAKGSRVSRIQVDPQ